MAEKSVMVPYIGGVQRDIEKNVYVIDVEIFDDERKRFEWPITIECGVLDNRHPQDVMSIFAACANRAIAKVHDIAARKPFVGRRVEVDGRAAEITSVDPALDETLFVTVRDDAGWRLRVEWERCKCL